MWGVASPPLDVTVYLVLNDFGPLGRASERNSSATKTEMSDRQFSTRCGGHLMTHHPTFGLTDVHAAVPSRVTFEPVIHLHYAETVLPMKDGLRKLHIFSSRRMIRQAGSRVAEPARRRIDKDDFRLYALFTLTRGDASSHRLSQS